MKIENRQHILAVVAAAAVALLAGDKLLLSPLTRSWKERAARITVLREAISQGSLLLEREQNLHQKWSRMETNMLPGDVSAAEDAVLKAFDRWSQESRIGITSIKPQWKRADENSATLECRADGFGTLQALTRFLYEMEKDPLALKVESVEITARDNDGQQLALGLLVSGLQLNPEQP